MLSAIAEAKTWVGTHYDPIGKASKKTIGGDCSGSTYKIFMESGKKYAYLTSKDFEVSAATECVPFKSVPIEEKQIGDVLHFYKHVAIYAGKNEHGKDMMFSAQSRGYKLQEIKGFGKKIDAVYRYQVDNK